MVGSAIAAGTWVVLSMLPAVYGLVVTCIFVGQIGTVCADVVCDSIVVEMVRETETGLETRGKLQSQNTVLRFVGATIAALISGFGLTIFQPRILFIATALPLIVVCIFAIIWKEGPIKDALYAELCEEDKSYDGIEVCVREMGVQTHHRVSQRRAFNIRLKTLWEALKNKKIIAPALFLFFLNAMPSASGPVFFFFTEKLGFQSWFLSIVSVVRHTAGATGAYIYRRWFRKTPLRKIIVWTVCIITLLQMSQLILVTDAYKSLGLNPAIFVVGDETVDAITESLLLLPCMVLVAQLCGSGIEGSLYASIIALSNAGGLLSSLGGAALSSSLGIQMTNFTNLWLLVLICGLCIPLPLVFVRWIPRT